MGSETSPMIRCKLLGKSKRLSARVFCIIIYVKYNITSIIPIGGD